MFECTPDESVYNPRGSILGGLVCTVADTFAGCAVKTTLEAGITSIDITVNYLRPATLESGALIATGRVQTGSPRRDGHGRRARQARRLVATATSNCLIIASWLTSSPRPRTPLGPGVPTP